LAFSVDSLDFGSLTLVLVSPTLLAGNEGVLVAFAEYMSFSRWLKRWTEEMDVWKDQALGALFGTGCQGMISTICISPIWLFG
jgi:hypothetical protein